MCITMGRYHYQYYFHIIWRIKLASIIAWVVIGLLVTGTSVGIIYMLKESFDNEGIAGVIATIVVFAAAILFYELGTSGYV